MQTITSISPLKRIVVLLSFFLPYMVNSQGNNPPINNVIGDIFNEDSFVLINGIEQWITVKGNPSKPVILFLHGGPGSPISPYSDNIYTDFEKDFIIVQWDQRGTAKTFGRNAPEELTPEYLKANPLSLEQMVEDGIAVSEYLLKHLNKQKIILFGTSWGSLLGVKMATKRPDLYYAYVAHAQIVNPDDDTRLYKSVYNMAVAKKDTQSLTTLNAIGIPPYDRAQKVGKLIRVVKNYERENANPAPDSWFTVAAEYYNDKDNQNRSDGDDYSFINYVGDSRIGIRSMRKGVNLGSDNLVFKIPVFIIQGSEDLLTPKELSSSYFDILVAPEKKYFLIPNAAHGFNEEVLETQYKIFKAIKAL